jgi:hypothetical protein
MLPSSSQAFSSLQDFSKKRRSTQDLQGEADSKYNVAGQTSRLSNLRTLVGNLESSVEQVDPSVTGRLAGGFATEGQRSALVNRERAPILSDLGKQQGALGDAQNDFATSSSLASQMVQNARSDDDTQYQRLLDEYNGANASEQAAEAKRQFDASLAVEKSKIPAASSGYDIGSILSSLGLSGSTKSKTASGGTDTNQKAYNDVKGLLSKGSSRIQQEYNAIKKSASFGNAYDKIKLGLIEQLYPTAKNFGKSTVSLTKPALTTIPLNSTPKYTGLAVGNASSGNLSVR